jgi:hypothetical protein
VWLQLRRQQPGRGYARPGGFRGEAFGEDAVFGGDPANANPDGANALHWKNLRPRLESLLTIHGVVLAKIQDPKESESKER